MELVYLWVEEYKNIKNQGFNFSPRFTCNYENGKLTIEEKKDYVSIFPENINITAIVGENGSGKSSLLEALYLMPNTSNNKIFYVYTLDSKSFYYKTNFDFSIKSKNTTLRKDDIETSYLGLSFIPNLQSKILSRKKKEDRVSYTENYKMEFLYKFIDVFKEDNQVLKKVDDKFVFDTLKITIYRNNLVSKTELNIQRGLGSLHADLSHKEYEKFLNDTHKHIEKLIQDNIKTSKENGLIGKLELAQMKNSSGDLIKDIKISFLIEYINNLSSLFSNIENINYAKFKLIKNIFDDLSFENMFEKIEEFEKKINAHVIHLKDVQNNIKLVKEWIQFCEENKDLFTKQNNNFCLTLNLDDGLIKKVFYFKSLFTINNEFNTFTLLEIELLSYEAQIDFFGLSSGEQKRLALYIEIIYSYFFSKSKILLLDEPDTFLHPQWNKIFINDLLKSLPVDSANKHLVMTSHSPFILSDIPKGNVIFLEKGKQVFPNIETFGANIHTLLSHGFFMKDGLMGEFAKNKINEVIDYLNGKASPIKDDDEAQRYIRIIGEPILKRQLQKMLDSKRLTRIDDINNKIKDMEYELSVLKKYQKKATKDELKDRGKRKYNKKKQDDQQS